MDNTTARAILSGFAEHRSAALVTLEITKWSWQPGVVLFPEAICAWCGDAMRSNRIWLVDHRAKKLNGQIDVTGGRLIREPASHPHVMSHGTICMHDARDVVSALFLGMSMAHSIWQNSYRADWDVRWKAWMVKMFDHDCKSTGRHGEMKAKLAEEMAKVEKAELVAAAPVFTGDGDPALIDVVFGTGITV